MALGHSKQPHKNLMLRLEVLVVVVTSVTHMRIICFGLSMVSFLKAQTLFAFYMFLADFLIDFS